MTTPSEGRFQAGSNTHHACVLTAQPARRSLSPSTLMAFVAIAVLAVAGCQGCGPSAAEVRSATDQASQRFHGAERQGLDAAGDRATAAAVGESARFVGAAIESFDAEGDAAFLATCRAHTRAGDAQAAVDCFAEATQAGASSTAVLMGQADALRANGQFPEAREVLTLLRDREPNNTAIRQALFSAWAEDPEFVRPVHTLERGVDYDLIRSLGGGSTITLRLQLGDDTLAALKVDQTRRQSNYRAEIAAYRLCPMLRCGFNIPYSYEVRIERREFMRGYRISSLDPEFLATHEGYAANFVDLIWTTEDGESYLHGVWKAWASHFTQFAIEYESVWEDWVVWDGDPTLLDQPFEDAIRPLRGRDRGRYDELLEERGDITTRSLARQISNLLVFDFLINNWDRFSGAYYGVNCQFADGHFLSLDNGAGFMTREPERPRQRLHMVTRFSRTMIREIREMDTEAFLPVLFPNPTAQEEEMWEAFEVRRQELLQYVDELIEAHGEDQVLFFE
ncbi:MAG: tetratricopeptide repeat protein [Myxococcales bacterium]|nr:tetratricopeptide repeat protein [Myxococcales bacterium]